MQSTIVNSLFEIKQFLKHMTELRLPFFCFYFCNICQFRLHPYIEHVKWKRKVDCFCKSPSSDPHKMKLSRQFNIVRSDVFMSNANNKEEKKEQIPNICISFCIQFHGNIFGFFPSIRLRIHSLEVFVRSMLMLSTINVTQNNTHTYRQKQTEIIKPQARQKLLIGTKT